MLFSLNHPLAGHSTQASSKIIISHAFSCTYSCFAGELTGRFAPLLHTCPYLLDVATTAPPSADRAALAPPSRRVLASPWQVLAQHPRVIPDLLQRLQRTPFCHLPAAPAPRVTTLDVPVRAPHPSRQHPHALPVPTNASSRKGVEGATESSTCTRISARVTCLHLLARGGSACSSVAACEPSQHQPLRQLQRPAFGRSLKYHAAIAPCVCRSPVVHQVPHPLAIGVVVLDADELAGLGQAEDGLQPLLWAASNLRQVFKRACSFISSLFKNILELSCIEFKTRTQHDLAKVRASVQQRHHVFPYILL